MTKQVRTWSFISKSLEQQIPVMLLYVLQSEGSSPGRQGFFMAVNAVGETEGSIGGGIMEHKFVEMAKERLLQMEPPVIKKQFHNKTAPVNQSGMICSGEQTILLYHVLPEEAPVIHNLLTVITGTLQLSPQGLQFSPQPPDDGYSFSMTSDNDWLYREKTGYKDHLHIIGAGHCALALSQTMHNMDFFIHVYDDRSALPTLEQNAWAHEKTIVDDYSQLNELISSGAHQYVVIMTVGYRTDDIAIRSLCKKEFRYFGVLGSTTKIEKMFADYKNEGILVEHVHAPVGLAIHSQTPEEIAISIAAEIIQVKNS